MERDGQILRNRRGHYGLIDKMDMICGHIIGHPDGYGFLSPESGGDDLFLPANAMRQVLHGDKVVARVSGVDARGRKDHVVHVRGGDFGGDGQEVFERDGGDRAADAVDDGGVPLDKGMGAG